MSWNDETEPITSSEDVIDSREIDSRIQYLEASIAEVSVEETSEGVLWAVTEDERKGPYSSREEALGDWLSMEEQQELGQLREFRDEAFSGEWPYGVTLVRDSYFEDYARDLAKETGAIPNDASWPATCIDWEQAARELQMDYTPAEFDGVTYWYR